MNVVAQSSSSCHHRASLAGASGRSGEKNASSRLRPSSSPWRGRYARRGGVLEERGDAQRLSVVAEPSPVMDDEYNDETKNEEENEEEEQGCAIAIVGTGACPHCKRAKSALDKLGVKHFDVDVDAFEREESGERILKLSKSISKMRSVPQIYVNGEIIGGADELMIALEDGSLMEKIRDEKTMEKSASALPEIIVRELLKEKMCKENALGVEECGIHTDVNRREEEEEEERVGKTDATVTTTTKQSDIKFTDEIPYEGLVHIINMAREDPETEGGLKLVETKRKTIIPFCPQKYPRTFSAERFIQWLLMKDICADRKAALDVGEMMVQEELMHSIDRTDAFTSANIDPVKFGVNGYQKGIFRFQKDEVEVGVAGLNSEFIFRGEARDATTVANDLRKRILDLYGSFLNADGTRVDYEGMKESEKFEEYKTVAAELQRCDPRLLNRNDRMAFFINVYNALIVHATIVKGVPDNALKRLKFFDEAKYDIGGLQYSANDIEHGVLRSNRPSPAAIGVLLGKPELSRGPFKNGEEIDEQLEDATFAFIEGDVEVDYRCSFIVNRASGKSTDVEKPCIVDEIRASKIIAEWYKTDF